MTKYHHNYDAYPFSDTAFQISLATTVEQTIVVPGTKTYRARFSYPENANVYVGLNTTAASPASGTATETPNLEYKPDSRYVKGGDEISFVTPDAAGTYVGVSLLELPS